MTSAVDFVEVVVESVLALENHATVGAREMTAIVKGSRHLRRVSVTP